MDRLIGRKEILSVIEEMYHIQTWPGALKFIKTHKLPLRRTPCGKPMFFVLELVDHDMKFQNIADR